MTHFNGKSKFLSFIDSVLANHQTFQLNNQRAIAVNRWLSTTEVKPILPGLSKHFAIGYFLQTTRTEGFPFNGQFSFHSLPQVGNYLNMLFVIKFLNKGIVFSVFRAGKQSSGIIQRFFYQFLGPLWFLPSTIASARVLGRLAPIVTSSTNQRERLRTTRTYVGPVDFALQHVAVQALGRFLRFEMPLHFPGKSLVKQ